MIQASAAFRIRAPAVAGLFYPDEPYDLRVTVRSLLDEAAQPVGPCPKALVVPHAGYAYSGAVAASAYHQLAGAAGRIERVVLAGPAHRVALAGIAVPEAAAFDTPLGRVPLDLETLARLARLPGVVQSDLPHRLEHSLEVQLPFLQTVLGRFRLVPLAVGAATAEEVATALEAAWGGPETLVVVSSDLSHYHGYADAQRLDAETTERLVALDDRLTENQACGSAAVNGLMRVARAHGLSVSVLDVRNSGDTSGDRSRVVGYGAYALHEPR